jgi:hypothetical protein
MFGAPCPERPYERIFCGISGAVVIALILLVLRAPVPDLPRNLAIGLGQSVLPSERNPG